MASESVLLDDTDDVEKGIAAGITQRLNDIISKGDAADVARRAGVPYPSLLKYLSGRQMRPAALVAIARATGVRIEWLIMGEGAMREGAAAPPPAPRSESPPPGPFLLFGKVKIDRLVQAYEGALATTRGQDKRLTMHLTVVLHDQLAQAEEATETKA